MCEICEHTKTRTRLQVNADRRDPSRTLTLRNAFVSEMNRRFRRITRAIRMAVVDDDVFGLNNPQNRGLRVHVSTPGPGAFSFGTSQQKINQFMRWLDAQVQQELLTVGTAQQVGSGLNPMWTDKYIVDSYKRGIQRARYEMRGAGYGTPSLEATGGLTAAMNGPFHLDRVGILYARVFEDLRGITTQMDTQISRILAQGMADGDGPRFLARKMNAAIIGQGLGTLDLTDTLGRFIPARRRAEILARTEVIRAHHQAMIQEYRNYGVAGVSVQAEWMTAGDPRVCSICESMVGNGPNTDGSYPLDVIQNMIPAHPQCRCIALPIPASEVIPQEDDLSHYEWEPTKNINAINNQLDLKYNMIISNFEGGGFQAPHLKSRANAIGEAMAQMYTRLPDLSRKNWIYGHPNTPGSIHRNLISNRIKLEVMEGQIQFQCRGVLADYNNISKEIRVAANTMARKNATLHIGSAHNVGTDLTTVFRHEYGHHIYNDFAGQKRRMAWEQYFNRKGKHWWRQNVSEYGATNEREAFSEAFAAYTHPQYGQPKRLPRSLEEEIEKIVGRRNDLR